MSGEWKGEFTKELEYLYKQYSNMFGGCPDEYMNVDSNIFDYDTWVKAIKFAIEHEMEMPEALGPELTYRT